MIAALHLDLNLSSGQHPFIQYDLNKLHIPRRAECLPGLHGQASTTRGPALLLRWGWGTHKMQPSKTCIVLKPVHIHLIKLTNKIKILHFNQVGFLQAMSVSMLV